MSFLRLCDDRRGLAAVEFGLTAPGFFILIAASIMSKKLAVGGTHLLLDVKYGSGAFMKTIDLARELARAMVQGGSAESQGSVPEQAGR